MSTTAPPPAHPVRRPGRTEATRHKVFQASMELIGERGTHGVTVDEIAAAAGVSKGTVYYNFGSKSELIGQLLRFGADLLIERLRAGADRPGPREALGAMARAALEFMEEYPSFAQLWVSEMWRTPSEWRTTLEALRADVLGVVRAAVERALPAPEPGAPGAAHTGQDGAGARPGGPADLGDSAGTGTSAGARADVVATAVFGATLVLGRDRHAFHPERGIDECVEAVLAFLPRA
ncbi:TetR/AcrR family transcriptional regulator [Zafaria sp. Z1313]|uniref:TetR/AcrR family transcriptional regulator n=1 Tax=unclassified Zafaria TaxID=2828765 RepID=UPI002E76C2A6|nr:TetR/AcrR family transcriptional regulator [Zafaria sp. J156]MEE1622065.1 TetR/AcrR family transcriptional regulator [Zafaria sp. J156]